jgi:hypothetical protein
VNGPLGPVIPCPIKAVTEPFERKRGKADVKNIEFTGEKAERTGTSLYPLFCNKYV